MNNGLLYDMALYAAGMLLRVAPLLVAAIFLAESARLWLGDDRLRNLLAGKNLWTGRLRAAALGAVLPFCECGAFPMMLGLIRAGVPASAVLTFFLVSPVVSMPAFMILIAVFSLPFALAYLAITVLSALAAGFILEPLGRRWGMFKEGVAVDKKVNRLSQAAAGCVSSCNEAESGANCCSTATKISGLEAEQGTGKYSAIFVPAWGHTFRLLKKIAPYMAVVILVSTLLSNLVPQGVIEQYILERAPFDVLAGALVGIPVYSGDCAMIALAAPLISATGAAGAGIAFIISGSGTSISGIVFMSSVFKRNFLCLYVFTVFCIALIVGYSISALLAFGLV